jgi:hypothetical protein
MSYYEKTIKGMMAEIQSLEQKLAIAVEGLKNCADSENYGSRGLSIAYEALSKLSTETRGE